MDVVRLNFSWGTYDEHAGYIAATRDVAKELGKTVPIIQDLSGPRVQGGDGHHFAEGTADILTEKDLRDLQFGVSQNVEYVAMSYVGTAADIARLRNEIAKAGGSSSVIAKIERKEALDNLDEIIAASDAVMVARGDLGNEISLERIPFIQWDIIKACKKAEKPVITATQMLVSMTESPSPTRAEVTDVAFAVLIGSDAVMLSEETARGKHPIEAVAVMEQIVQEAEKHEFAAKLNPL